MNGILALVLFIQLDKFSLFSRVVKETIVKYVNSKSDVYECFLDISKSIDSFISWNLDGRVVSLCYLQYMMNVDLIRHWPENHFWVNMRFVSRGSV